MDILHFKGRDVPRSHESGRSALVARQLPNAPVVIRRGHGCNPYAVRWSADCPFGATCVTAMK